MIDRMPDFEDIEFDDLEPVVSGTAAPAPAAAVAAPSPAASAPASAKAEPAKAAAAGAPKGLIFALLGVSTLSLLTTIGFAAAMLTKADPVASLDPETKASIVKIEAQLAGQQKKLEALALALPPAAPASPAASVDALAAAASTAPAVGTAELDSLAAAIHANQKVLESLPQAVVAQLEARLARIEGAQRTRANAAPRRPAPRVTRQVREAPARPLRVEVAAVKPAAAPAQDDEIRYP